MVARGIFHQLECTHLLPSTHGWYGPKWETWSNELVCAHVVHDSFHTGINMLAAEIVPGARFNRVPLNYLITQVHEFNINTFLLNLISAVLFQRMVAFRCGSWTPEHVVMHPGLQDSPLSLVPLRGYTVRTTGEQTTGRRRADVKKIISTSGQRSEAGCWRTSYRIRPHVASALANPGKAIPWVLSSDKHYPLYKDIMRYWC